LSAQSTRLLYADSVHSRRFLSAFEKTWDHALNTDFTSIDHIKSHERDMKYHCSEIFCE
jgi:hypothetical protein